MKITLPVTILSILFAALISFSLMVCSLPQRNVPAKPANHPQETWYQLRDYQGHLSVYKSGEEKPILVFETFTSLLPDYDRRQLSTTGVTVTNYHDLMARIEDYIS